MSKFEDIKSSFESKLDATRQQHAARLEADLQELRARLLREFKPSIPPDLIRSLADFNTPLQNRLTMSQPLKGGTRLQALMDIKGSPQLRQLDQAFAQHFNLARYYPAEKLNYKTILCDTLEQFYQPILDQYDMSPQARQVELHRKVAEDETFAMKTNGGGTLGVYLPGKGCYINGWLHVFGMDNITPKQAFDNNPVLASRILETAIHEKLGHGFLGEYSALGVVMTQNGLDLVEISAKFGIRLADDPSLGLKEAQAHLLFDTSQLLEEGWATWVATYLAKGYSNNGVYLRDNLGLIMQAIDKLPYDDKLSYDLHDRESLRDRFKDSLAILFVKQEYDPAELQWAVTFIEDWGLKLDDYFSHAILQPLRYAVGELLFVQASENLGPLCMPYAALIAANVDIDLSKISLSDLGVMMLTKISYNPDARLAAVSRLRLNEQNSISEMVSRIEAQYSFIAPRKLKAR